MVHDAYPSARPKRRRSRRIPAAPLVLAGLGAAVAWIVRPEAPQQASPVPAPAPAAVRPAPAPARHAWMLDPAPVLGPAAARLGQEVGYEAPPATGFRSSRPPAAAPAAIVVAVPAPPQAAPTAVPSAPEVNRLALVAPPPRPEEFRRAPSPTLARMAARRVRTQEVFRAAGTSEPSFLERLFGGSSAPLAYASADPAADIAPRARLTPAPPQAGGGTAVYDISAATVTLPSGERLEAHSGLGRHIDDPRYAHLSMRGVTPPGTYDLREREAPFHGVRAIRLNPVGGPGAIHGRVGLLAHTYMLGPSGQSNGCLVFRNYDRFLQAYLRGEVSRLVVVAGRFQDGPPRRVADGG